MSDIWFLTGSQLLYGEQTLRQVAEQSKQVVAMLEEGATIPARIVWQPVLTDSDAIRRACLAATADEDCIGVITWMHTFSPAKAWIAGLQALGKPLLHLHTQANRSLPWHSIDMDFMNLNQAAHGDREFAYLATRIGLRRATVAGHATDGRVHRRIADWARAAAGWQAAHRLRMARFGDIMRGVADTEGDKVEAQLRLGASIDAVPLAELVAAVDAASGTAIDGAVAEYEKDYEVAPALRAGGLRHESLRYAAAIEVGLRRLLEAGGYTAFTTNFEDLAGLRQLPGIAVQRLMSDGYGFGAEGDWKSALLLRVLKVMADGLPGGTSFMEDYTYHFGPGEPKILGAHMLEICPSIADGTPRCEIHPLTIGNREDPVRLVFDAAPGPGLVAGMVDMGDRLRLVANTVELVPPDEPLPRLPVARAVWQPAPDFATATEAWLSAGGPHHTVLSTAVGADSLADLAQLADIELVHIDATTTAAGIAQALRWNAAHYRMRGH
ncbi:MAG: L-arabinose isomerase [Micromonosporaceae bacterium]|nr:L-arabinose isomerase [Micromonosporaceae bacterium]